MPLGFIGLGGQEILIICVAALILFGATRVPQFMRGLGQGVKEFKEAIKDEPPPPPPTSSPDEDKTLPQG